MVDAYDPDVVLRTRRPAAGRPSAASGTAHDLHPDLALLLSTSGSTGSPKLVRLSHDNLRSNAASIATYLRLTPGRPRGHLAAAALLLRPLGGEQPPADRRRAGADRALGRRRVLLGPLPTRPARRRSPACPTPSTCSTGPASPTATCPTLRYVTQAGGRLGPDRVRRVRRARAAARLGPRRHVRPDRGDRPDGLPAARARRARARRRSACRSRAARSGSSRCPRPPSPAPASSSTPGPT